MLTWFLAYLLVGFGLHFLAASVLGIESRLGWRWDLFGLAVWPVSIVAALIVGRHYWISSILSVVLLLLTLAILTGCADSGRFYNQYDKSNYEPINPVRR